MVHVDDIPQSIDAPLPASTTTTVVTSGGSSDNFESIEEIDIDNLLPGTVAHAEPLLQAQSDGSSGLGNPRLKQRRILGGRKEKKKDRSGPSNRKVSSISRTQSSYRV